MAKRYTKDCPYKGVDFLDRTPCHVIPDRMGWLCNTPGCWNAGEKLAGFDTGGNWTKKTFRLFLGSLEKEERGFVLHTIASAFHIDIDFERFERCFPKIVEKLQIGEAS